MPEWYELNPVFDDQGKPKYHNEEVEVVFITPLGTVKEYANRDFGSVTIIGPNETPVTGQSVSYAKGDKRLTPEDLNKPVKCRVKVENASNQYAYNGRKFTFTFSAKQSKSGSGYKGGSGGGRSYTPESPATVRSKIDTIYKAAEIGRIGAEALIQDQGALDAIDTMVDVKMKEIEAAGN